MDIKIEEEILQKFFEKNARDRILWELRKGEKRLTGISKICSPDMGYLKSSTILPIDRNILETELICLLQERGAEKEAYIISIEFVGKVLLSEGISMMNKETGSLLYCGHGIGCFQQERFPKCGAARKFLLVDNRC